MSENTLDPTWYDFEVKQAYYHTVSETQRPYLLSMFRTMNAQEVSLQTPLYNQTAAQLESFFFSLRPLTMKTSYKGISATIRYIRYAIENGYRDTNILFVDNSYGYAKRFIPQNAKEFITPQQLKSLLDACINPQDQVVFQLLFEGIRGEKLYELRSLRLSGISDKQDAQGRYPIQLTQVDGSTRQTSISKLLYRICMQASLQMKYKLNNGRPVAEEVQGARGDFQYLNKTGYILKRSRIGSSARNFNDPVTYHAVYSRIKRVLRYDEFEGLDPDYLKPQSLYNSGALYYAYHIIANQHEGPVPFVSLSRWEKHKIYDSVDWLAIRKQVASQYVSLSYDSQRLILCEDNLKKYYS